MIVDVDGTATGAQTPSSEIRSRAAGPRFVRLERVSWHETREVWRARQRWPDRPVAMKIARDPATLRTELEALSRLRHPAVPQVLGRVVLGPEETNGGPAHGIAMEWVEGHTFETAARGLPLEGRLRLFRSVCEAVSAVHAAGVVHGDLKSPNLIVDDEGEVHIIDFGSAVLDGRALERASSEGSLPYAAPERAARGTVDARTDVYSLGVILYELLTGARPWRAEESEGPAALLRALATQDPPSPRRLVPSLAPAWEAIAARALAANPAARYESAGALADDVGRALARRPVRARIPGRIERLRDYLRRRPSQGVLVGTIALLLIVGFGVSLNDALAERDSDEQSQQVREGLEETVTWILDRVDDLGERAGTLEDRRRWLQIVETALSVLHDRPLLAREEKLVADFYCELGRCDEAAAHYERARDLYAELYARSGSTDHGAGLSIACVRVGDLAKDRGDLDTADECYAEAFQLDQVLHDLDPEDLTLLDNLGYSHERIGALARRRGDIEGAEEHFAERHRIAVEVFEQDPRPLRALALVHSTSLLGRMAGAAGDKAGQREWLLAALEWGEWIQVRDPKNRNFARRHVSAILALARTHPAALERQGGLDRWLQRALEIARRVHALDPHDLEARQSLIGAEKSWAERRAESGDLLSAIESMEQLLEQMCGTNGSHHGDGVAGESEAHRNWTVCAEWTIRKRLIPWYQELPGSGGERAAMECGRAGLESLRAAATAESPEATEHEPRSPARCVLAAHAHLTVSPPELRDPELALEFARRGERIDPDDPEVLALLVRAHAALGDRPAAHVVLDRARRARASGYLEAEELENIAQWISTSEGP